MKLKEVINISRQLQVGVLSSHVHSLVMSSNGMDGIIPSDIGKLTHLRMIELATMAGLVVDIYNNYEVISQF